MTEQTKVVADGLENADRGGEPRLFWGWLAAGTLIGFGLAFLLFGADPIPPAPTEAVVRNELVLEGSRQGIGETVPGFKDGLVAVTSTDGQTMDLTFWPVAGPELDRNMPLGTATTREQVRFDASGRRVAAMHFVPGEAFSGLAVGVPASVRLIDIDVTGYAWHDSVPGSLAYTTIEGRVLRIWNLDIASTEPNLLTSHADLDGGLVAYGEWGYAIQDAGMSEVTVLSPAGVIAGSQPGRFLASAGDGRLAVKSGTVEILEGAGAITDFEGFLDTVGDPKTAEFSPDGRKLAVLGDGGLLVVPVKGDSDVAHAEPRTGIAQIAWTSDSRFVLIPALRGLTIVDTRNSGLHNVFADRTVFAVAVLPLSSS